ncbi:hypothetical protein [Glutamicibacter sp. 0426]|uniref:hypothetical protein n=1 Tax=Glutamicibacter sp. 0426 TaxID=1913445 RepID=UPI0011612341|nr:hypothetical protein [Glutamicibacter sp. 0426]
MDLLICTHVVDQGTDWPQVIMTGLGVLVAAIVAIFVGSNQHRAQVLQRARQGVANFLTAADRTFEQMTLAYDSGQVNPDSWKTSYGEMEAAANIVRLTAPDRIYQEAVALEGNLQQIELWLTKKWPDANDYSDPNSLVCRISQHSEIKQRVVAGAVNYTWFAKRKAAFLDNFERNRELRRMRKAGIEGCVDGPSFYDRSS